MQYSVKKTLELPDWAEMITQSPLLTTDEEKMEFVIHLANENIINNTGGPFSAAVFNLNSNELISIGVNVVVEQNCSVAHAEVMALSLAQEKIKSHRLHPDDYVLFSSAQPCIMCYGAVMWSGITKLVYGATKDDVESLTGFDEGPAIEYWKKELEHRNITVVEGLLREKACSILTKYKSMDGLLY